MRVGATWIEPSDYQDFMVEVLHTPWYFAQKEIQVKFSEVNGDEIRVLNKKETMLASQKQDAMKAAFKDWIFKDQQR